ncbi:flavodoxin [Candidatus Saccharibacteria bacterium]|nr:flavodoxin [Candidatus Saccharibacteria bacterium]
MKTLVVYYSATGHTKRVAEEIAQNLNADLFEIVPAAPYSDKDLDWTDTDSRCSRENDNPELRDIELETTTVPNWDSYDQVIIGYPIWWGISAWPVNSFVKTQDFADKTVIPFCTSHSSGLDDSDLKLKNDAKGGNWQEGHRFFQDAPASAIKTWAESLS